MSQFGGAKNPPWARQTDFIAGAVSNSMNVLSQPQIATPLLSSSGMYNLGQTQYPSQQLAVNLPTQSGAMLPQPGIALPTTLATTQVATVSYPTPRSNQQQQGGPKQRVFTGTVTKLHDNFGFVDEDVFFQATSVKGAVPKVGDRVLVEASYNANMPFKWNATRIQVLPNQGNPQANMQSLLPAGNTLIKNQNLINPGLAPGMGLGLSALAQGLGGNIAGQPPSLLGPGHVGGILSGPTTMRHNIGTARRTDPSRFDRERERDRERDLNRDRRDKRENRPATKRSRSPSSRRSRSPTSRQRSPTRRRAAPRVAPRYVVNVPKIALNKLDANVITLKSSYPNMYVPSDFVLADFKWGQAFPMHRPFQLGQEVNFHVFHKEIAPLLVPDTEYEPPDCDHLYSAKVLLLSCPSLNTLYHKACSMADDPIEDRESFQHPTRLIQFLVGLRGKCEPMAIGGPWSPSLDGTNPADDPKVLINTAIRTTRALTGIDLSACTQWYRFAEVRYLRPQETHKGRVLPARIETVVLFLPAVWSCNPTQLEWEGLQTAYKQQLNKVLSAEGKDDHSQEDEDMEESLDEKKEPSHHSDLDPRTMKIVDLRRELECRSMSSKGLKSQLIARLTKCLKTEQEKEEEEGDTISLGTEEIEKDELKAEIDEKEEENKKKDVKEVDDKKKKDIKEQAILTRWHTLPEQKAILVHPSTTAKSGRFDCTVMSLSVLLDYRPEDNKEHSFEVSLFAELFNEMLMRDFGFRIYKTLVNAPEKKEEEKDKKDKEKKTDEKTAANKEPLIKKKKMEEKDDADALKDKKERKDSQDKSKKDKSGKSKVEDDKRKDEDVDTEDEYGDEEEDDEKGDGEKSDKRDGGGKDKKKKGKMITIDPDVLLAFVYFDQNHTGYLQDKDVEDILHIIGLQLSRAQCKKLVQKLTTKDVLNYRSITDKATSEVTEDDPKVNEIETDEENLAMGNNDYLASSKKTSNEASTKHAAEKNKNDGASLSGLISYRGSMLDVGSLLQRLEKSDKTRLDTEHRLMEVSSSIEKLKNSVTTHEDSSHKLKTELDELRDKLDDQTKSTKSAESRLKRVMETLSHSRESLTTIASSMLTAFEECSDKKHVKSEPKMKSELKSNGSNS